MRFLLHKKTKRTKLKSLGSLNVSLVLTCLVISLLITGCLGNTESKDTSVSTPNRQSTQSQTPTSILASTNAAFTDDAANEALKLNVTEVSQKHKSYFKHSETVNFSNFAGKWKGTMMQRGWTHDVSGLIDLDGLFVVINTTLQEQYSISQLRHIDGQYYEALLLFSRAGIGKVERPVNVKANDNVIEITTKEQVEQERAIAPTILLRRDNIKSKLNVAMLSDLNLSPEATKGMLSIELDVAGSGELSIGDCKTPITMGDSQGINGAVNFTIVSGAEQFCGGEFGESESSSLGVITLENNRLNISIMHSATQKQRYFSVDMFDLLTGAVFDEVN